MPRQLSFHRFFFANPYLSLSFFFFFQAEDGIRDLYVTGVQTCALPIYVFLGVGHQKGANTKENVARNFGMALPEGYRKALRLMRHAEKFGFPVITFIDTPGAEPGLQGEERGMALAIADDLLAMLTLRVPILTVIIGEGGSGGALAIGLGDRILMLENAMYSVASPEAAATILWRNAAQAAQAAAAMRINAQDLHEFGIVDRVIPEPDGGAHTDVPAIMDSVAAALREELAALDAPLRT